MKKKFWKLVNQAPSQATESPAAETATPAERTLYISGNIADEQWFDDEVTPQIFKDELFSGEGNLTVWINSLGGDCIAAAQIYNMLREYSKDKGKVTVKIDGIAASAASVIAMAGDEVLMSPVSVILIHNPSTIAIGDKAVMEKTGAMLDEVKESIINAYEIKTGLSRDEISQLMDDDTWMSAKKAVRLGFADGIIDGGVLLEDVVKNMASLTQRQQNSFDVAQLSQTLVNLHNAVQAAVETIQTANAVQDGKAATQSILTENKPTGRSANELFGRLDLIKQSF